MTIASLSSVSRAAYFGILAIATKPWLLYLAAGLNSLAGLQGILIRWTIKEFCRIFPPLRGPFWHSKSASKPSHRSGLAAVLPPSELGSVFSLIETIAATFPLILAPLASATYTAELEKEMELFNVCTGEQKARHICPISNYLFLVFDFEEYCILTLFQLPPLATLTDFPGAWALAAGLPMLPQLLLFSAAGIIQARYISSSRC